MIAMILRRLALLACLFAASAAWAQDKGEMLLFKVVTVKDDVTVGFTRGQVAAMGAGASPVEIVSRELARQGQMPVWQYGSAKGKDGALQMAPLRQIVIFAANTARVEPYASPLPVLPQPM